jgi:hypothetical protein
MLLLIVGGGIALAVVKNSDEKKENTAKWGYDPVRQNFKDLPKEQQEDVQSRWDNEAINKSEKITQMTRRANEGQYKKCLELYPQQIGEMSKNLGKDNTMPSLESFQTMANRLPSSLGSELMAAARAESRASAKKDTHRASINNTEAIKEHRVARANLDAVMEKVNTRGH